MPKLAETVGFVNQHPLESLLIVVGFVLGVGLLGLLVGRAGKPLLLGRIRELELLLERAESDAKEHIRSATKMRSELGTVANLALHLPHVVRDMNRHDLDRQEVQRLIFRLANAIFEPAQILLYLVKDGQLSLVAYHGIDSVPAALKSVPYGEGKIGWVAQHELDMLPEDWEKILRNERRRVPDNHPRMKTDIIGPLVQHSRHGLKLLGVLCLGAPRIRPGDEKLMFQLVTNIATLALVNQNSMSKLRVTANHDGLTKLFNKRHFLADLGPKALIACEQKARPFSIFIFDIDKFKQYNDELGHPDGDKLLEAMGKLILRCLRPQDTACRYGGEEFVVAMPDTDRETAFRLADRLRETVDSTSGALEREFAGCKQHPKGSVSISGGVACFPIDGSSVEELIKTADVALYTAKKGGRNRVALAGGQQIGDPAMEDAAQSPLAGALAGIEIGDADGGLQPSREPSPD